MTANGITDVAGIAVGHHTDAANGTGCTAVLCEAGAVGGVDVRGSSPGTRETDLLRPTNRITHVHGVLLSGGSAFGLDAASGVVRYLEERGAGYATGAGVVPIVPAAIIFDLGVVAASVRPGSVDGYAAALAASAGAVAEGSVGAGTGATVGKLLGAKRAVKGGLGTWALDLGGGLAVGALMVVNAVGGVHDPDTGELVAGARNPGGGMSGWLRAVRCAEFQRRGAACGREHDDRRRGHERGAHEGAGEQAGGGRARRDRARCAPGTHDVRRRYVVRAGDRRARRPCRLRPDLRCCDHGRGQGDRARRTSGKRTRRVPGGLGTLANAQSLQGYFTG